MRKTSAKFVYEITGVHRKSKKDKKRVLRTRVDIKSRVSISKNLDDDNPDLFSGSPKVRSQDSGESFIMEIDYADSIHDNIFFCVISKKMKLTLDQRNHQKKEETKQVFTRTINNIADPEGWSGATAMTRPDTKRFSIKVTSDSRPEQTPRSNKLKTEKDLAAVNELKGQVRNQQVSIESTVGYYLLQLLALVLCGFLITFMVKTFSLVSLVGDYFTRINSAIEINYCIWTINSIAFRYQREFSLTGSIAASNINISKIMVA